MSLVRYQLVQLPNGARTVRDLATGETFHPVIGPVAEAEALYVRQLRLRERLDENGGELVLWDVGLGAGANALAALHALSDLEGRLTLVSFDRTLDALRFGLEHAEALGYFADGRDAAQRIADGELRPGFRLNRLEALWQVQLGDFPGIIESTLNARVRASGSTAPLPAPHAIMYDAHSPMRNPEMWSLRLFGGIYRLLDPRRPCALSTYSRSTILRVTLLLAGFFVGVGHATGEKEETTIAANVLELIEEPLDRRWLDRALRSHSAEPLTEPEWRTLPLSEPHRERLKGHPQFA